MVSNKQLSKQLIKAWKVCNKDNKDILVSKDLWFLIIDRLEHSINQEEKKHE